MPPTPCPPYNYDKGLKPTTIQKALRNIEKAWEELKTTPVNMTAKEFEKRLLRQAKKHGTPYSTEVGKWLHEAKRVIANPRTPRSVKNLYLSECDPPELVPVLRRFYKAFNTLSLFAEWSYADLKAFCEDKKKDPILRAFLRWRQLPIAEAFHLRYHEIEPLLKRSTARKRFYLQMRPVVIFGS